MSPGHLGPLGQGLTVDECHGNEDLAVLNANIEHLDPVGVALDVGRKKSSVASAAMCTTRV